MWVFNFKYISFVGSSEVCPYNGGMGGRNGGRDKFKEKCKLQIGVPFIYPNLMDGPLDKFDPSLAIKLHP